MGVSYLAISAVSTALSFVGLQLWTEFSLDKLQTDGLISENIIHTENVNRALELLLGSYATVALLAIFVLNVFILLILSLKTVFFGELYPSETRKLVERLINYVIYKGTFLPLVIPPTIFQAGLWSIWLTVICCLKMFQALARDRLERLNASPSATPWAYFRVFSVFLFVISVNFFWIWLSFVIYRTLNSSMFLLLFFEPLSIAFETMQALLSAIVKRIKGFIKLRMALGALHAALPDATSEEIRAYEDECAICREPMAKAKKLHCNHLFHLACLRSWLDQGLNEVYSCPTCRKPLFLGRPENEANSRTGEALTDEQLARQINSGLDRQNVPGHTLPAGVFPNQMQNPVDGSPWRTAGLDSGWLHSWPNQSVDGAGPSTGIRSVGLGRVHMMMRHLASVGETYAQTALEDTAWSLWPMNPSQAAASTSSVPPNVGGRYPGNAGSLHMRTASRTANDNIANILAMAETVREVLPHVPDELIFQVMLGFTARTNSVTVTVNNLLQM
ncbi:RPM1 interacting protein 2 isoform 4 [Theobroma cacao]|uniref:RPM1 interacting protein 2 isoform 4 n=1 Tax=Theobroma cacao TaxID=3641 RepID=A0A061FZC6_THECC|nr:RPM1 interacting protein 2 isoform 4 [Theobroma cacao]